MTFRILSALCALCFMVIAPAGATSLQPVELAPIDHLDAQLIVEDKTGSEKQYSISDIEGLKTHRLVTKTPWRDEPATFDGVLLADLLAIHGLEDATRIVVYAENDYEAVLDREVWETVPVLVATRVDGQPITRRNRGPIQFVVPWDAYNRSDVVSESHLVWMAARIESAE